MQQINDINDTTNASTATNDLDTSLSSSTSSNKSSKYRAMIARADYNECRDAVRSKIESSREHRSIGSIESGDDRAETNDKNTEDIDFDANTEEIDLNKEDDTTQHGAVDPKSIDEVSVHSTDTETDDDHQEEDKDTPALYREWDHPDVKEEQLEDVELGNSSEQPVDYDAFEKIKTAEEEKKRTTRNFWLSFLSGFAFLVIFFLIVGLIIAIVHASKKVGSSDKQKNDPIAGVVVASPEIPLSLELEKVSNGPNAVVAIFKENIVVPDGTTMIQKNYDGPNCRDFNGGANDITNMDDYVTSGFYGTSPMSFYLFWNPDEVVNSPLYKHWGDLASDDHFGTMDLCVGLSFVDAQGNEVHYAETYILTTWDGDFLESVRAVPITKN